ncbi:MAG: type II toxin-antitoxin system VapC family toxin [Prosthecobacter sp.]|uniref:type II toxin-antitoxin system VapC family toxin n=1 Tax=Prosthecobacter sp. TaxID=1965333 RepID=UPI0038FF59F1
MKISFADTFFYVALLDVRDQHHERVNAHLREHDDFHVTTRWVLVELANALAGTAFRLAAARLISRLESDADTMVVKSNDELYERGLKLYIERPDKDWSLTDCISILVMQEHQITEALTRDRHFEQAGFRPVFA